MTPSHNEQKTKIKIDPEAQSFQLRLMALDPGRLYCLDGILNLFEASGIIDGSDRQEEAARLEPRGARYLGDKGQLFGWQWQGYDNWVDADKRLGDLVFENLPDDSSQRWSLLELVRRLDLPLREANTYFLLFQTQAFLVGRDPDRCYAEDDWFSSNKKKRSLHLLPAEACWPGPFCKDKWKHVFFVKSLTTLPAGFLKPGVQYAISDVQKQCFPETLDAGQDIVAAEDEYKNEWWLDAGNQEINRLGIYGLSRLLALPPEGETRSHNGTPKWSGAAWMNGLMVDARGMGTEGKLLQ